MAHSLDFERHPGVLVLRAHGDLHIGAVRRMLEAARVAGERWGLRHLLLDVRDVTSEELTAAEVRTLALERRTEVRGRVTHCAVVVGQEAHFGMARMYQTLTSDRPVTIEVFRDEGDALEWICPERLSEEA